MTLESNEILALKLADGLASPEERAAAEAAGVDVEATVQLRRVVARALTAPPLTLPGEAAFADRVLAAAGLSDGGVSAAVRAALDAGPAPELADPVLQAVGQQTPAPHALDVAAAHAAAAGATPELAGAVVARTHPDSADMGPLLQRALDGGPAPELGDAVLGSAPESAVLREALDGGVAPELGDAVVGPDALRPALQAALDGGAAPELADGVLAHAARDAGQLGAHLRAALDAGPPPDLSADVMGALGISGADLGAALLDGAGEAPDLGDAIMAALGTQADAPVADAVAASAGPAPDLWADIAAEIGAERPDVAPTVEEAAPAAAAGAEVVELAPRRRWWLPAAGVAAAAAAAVLAVVGMPTERASDGHGDLAAHIHLQAGHAEIEEISAGPEAMVQVLQFEEDAPTIIFIDVLEEPEGADGDEGVPL